MKKIIKRLVNLTAVSAICLSSVAVYATSGSVKVNQTVGDMNYSVTATKALMQKKVKCKASTSIDTKSSGYTVYVKAEAQNTQSGSSLDEDSNSDSKNTSVSFTVPLQNVTVFSTHEVRGNATKVKYTSATYTE